jgi:hypothetical protein
MVDEYGHVDLLGLFMAINNYNLFLKIVQVIANVVSIMAKPCVSLQLVYLQI